MVRITVSAADFELDQPRALDMVNGSVVVGCLAMHLPEAQSDGRSPMRILRYVVLLLSLIAIAPLSYAIIEDWSRQPHDVPWWAYLILLSIALNFIYALLSGTP